MGTYVTSNANRLYAAVEPAYATPASITAANRFPALGLDAHQSVQPGKRLDKTGTRTFLGSSVNSRRRTAFSLKTYLTSWNGSGQPGYGPLVQAAMGATPQFAPQLTVANIEADTQLTTTTSHGLTAGAALSSGPEIRFVTGILSADTVVLNAPFASVVPVGTVLAPAISYQLSNLLPSLTLYDYWDPAGGAISRLVTGAAVDVFEILINGDFLELIFTGPAADLLDSYSLSSFPAEPALSAFDYSIVPGHLGQVWLGAPANQFFTLTEASIAIKNNIGVRDQEFGSSYPRAIAPGPREVLSSFTLFAQDDAQTNGLYAAAKSRTPIPAMFQLGQQKGQIMGIFLPNVIPEIPIYNGSETRLLWEFKNNLGQGTSNDEIYVAFS